jgi:hypothetical protein
MAITISGGHRQVSISEVEPILQTTGCKITIIINGDPILPLMEEGLTQHSMVSIPIHQTLIRISGLCGTQITLGL